MKYVRFGSLTAYHYFFLNVRFQYKADIQEEVFTSPLTVNSITMSDTLKRVLLRVSILLFPDNP